MALVGSALLDKVTQDDPAKKAFQPWWDTTKDFLVYGLIFLGLVSMPTAMFYTTPLDCQVCKESLKNCDFMRGKEGFFPVGRTIDNKTILDPGYSTWWAKKYCNENYVHDFTLYFPYTFIIIPLLMVAVERIYVKFFKTSQKIDMFYHQLVAPGENLSFDFHESKKRVVGLVLQCLKTTNISKAYKYGKLTELFLFASMFSGFGYGFKLLYDDMNIHCVIYGVSYECDGHPVKFYHWVLTIAAALLLVYGILSLYAVIWIFSKTNLLYSSMERYRDAYKAKHGTLPNGLEQYFFQNQDVRLLLNFLTQSQGLATSLRVLALFDEDFYDDLRVPDICFPNLPPKTEKRIYSKNVIKILEDAVELQQEEERYDLDVAFDHAPANKTLFKDFGKMFFHYTIEISPQTESTSIIVVQNKTNQKNTEALGLVVAENDTGHVVLKDLDPSKEYIINIKTVADGIPIASRTEKFGPLLQDIAKSANDSSKGNAKEGKLVREV